ncbi:hypothetical protein SAMN05660841_01518 [Sphingobacterium nematocida]|uniref:Uncharacterized protein n=1 Tax=Sphingobacterium nematocida TaxID=1513896 RepID=A0A1T5CQL1_9SPHI|nr:hypothetical protein [Sphingobacterium nematocida]SKB61631.1 hypothetical protein SAMN05660841_01518 [Sphingobacterium nematocida]
MKRTLWMTLMVIWIACCPLLLLLSSPVVPSPSIAHITTSHFKPFKRLQAEQQSESPFTQQSIIEGTSELDLFSVVQKYLSSPHFFFLLVYGGLLIQFFFFFKRRLPLCYHLAPQAQYRYLTQRVLLI